MRPSQGMLSFALMSNTSPSRPPAPHTPHPQGGNTPWLWGRQKQRCVCRPLGLNASFMRPGWHGSDWVGWCGPSWKKHNWCLLYPLPLAPDYENIQNQLWCSIKMKKTKLFFSFKNLSFIFPSNCNKTINTNDLFCLKILWWPTGAKHDTTADCAVVNVRIGRQNEV